MIFVSSFKWGIALSIYCPRTTHAHNECHIHARSKPHPHPCTPKATSPKPYPRQYKLRIPINSTPTTNEHRLVSKGLPNAISAVSVLRFDSAHELHNAWQVLTVPCALSSAAAISGRCGRCDEWPLSASGQAERQPGIKHCLAWPSSC